MSGNNCKYYVYANLMNYNWDSIAGTGETNTCYDAYYNLQLNNSYSHAFDMHGTNLKPGEPEFQGGVFIKCYSNSFFMWGGNPAIGFGINLINPPPNPCGADITRNYFAQDIYYTRPNPDPLLSAPPPHNCYYINESVVYDDIMDLSIINYHDNMFDTHLVH